MKQKRTWISAGAAMLLIGVALTLFSQTTPKAYALADTLDAIKSVQSVSFRAYLYKQQCEISCKMRLNDQAAKPTHIRLYAADHPCSKIDNEHGSFAYNTETNRFRRIRRDERSSNWYPDFRQLFYQALAEADRDENVIIDRAIDLNTQQEMIVIDMRDKLRDVRYWIDPETKLPTRFSTVKAHDLQGLMRQTIVARDIWDIRYDESMPKDTFAIPEDADEVFEEIDTMVRPGMGLQVGDLTESEACLKLIQNTQNALNALDFATARKLCFPLGIPPQAVLVQLKTLHAQTAEPLIELLSHEEPYKDGPYWYVPCTVKDIRKGVNQDLVRIRFFEFNGIRSCMIAMPD